MYEHVKLLKNGNSFSSLLLYVINHVRLNIYRFGFLVYSGLAQAHPE